MDQQPNDRKSVLMMISAMLIFGTIGVFRRFIPVSSAFLTFSRGILGGMFILIFSRIKKGKPGSRLPRRTLLILSVTGALIGINWILLFEAYNHTTVAIATLCYYMQPTIVMLLSPLLFRERLTARKICCAAAAVAGMVLISGILEGGGAREGHLQGVLLGLGAACFYAAVIILNKRTPGIDAYQKTTVQLLSAGLVMIPYMLLTGGIGDTSFTASSILLMLVVGLVHTGIAYVLYFGSMDGLRVQSIAIFSYIDPVSALLFSALLLHEPLTVSAVVGAVMIIGSAIISETALTGKQG